MSGRESPVSGGKAARASAKEARLRRAGPWPLTVATAAALGLLVYIATTSLPYLISAPTSDPHFGALNHCLARLLQRPLLGWAVSPDASRAAVYGAQAMAVCTLPEGSQRFPLAGVRAVTFDRENRLWWSQAGQLWRDDGAEPMRMGDFSPVSLVSHEGGVLALDAEGQLVSVAPDGAVLGQVPVSGAEARLSVGAEGTFAAVLDEASLRFYEARTLTPLPVELPCEVAGLWWLERPERVLIACAQGDEQAFAMDLRTTRYEPVQRPPGEPARRLLGRPLYVHGCDGFPCTAPAP
uniref:Uncharacterized protein n=1 Tax=Myxococcus xanthus TaxID=34 RepID=A0AAE6G677_MYXXA|nr:hypothetical protein [Myxococcus xanthus]QDE71562.1 hypothetical protein BHS09_33785 [Myxococcus xanthus]QDE78843.1 hypothetical protein BHS08_33810 [Myxococcus xanthus]QDE86215.1 hypothetical protein BHS07_34375 [Myxococcus xanthus]